MKYLNQDERFMAQAIKLAQKAEGKTSPNPMVGCVIVKNGHIIGQGYHHKAGEPHAEILAFAEAGDKAVGATMYVTLEPCCIFGRTPPCTQTIINNKIRRVVIGINDPNPKVNGRGLIVLKDAGIEISSGVMKAECTDLIKPYTKYITTGMPFVTVKYAQSLDGRLATKSGSSQWISSPQALKYAHQLRAQSDAVLVGAGTANHDNPKLTVRLVKGNNPLRVVLSQSGKLKKDLHLLNDKRAHTVIITGDSAKFPKGCDVIRVPLYKDSLDLKAALLELGKQGVVNLLVEGGAKVITGFLKRGLVDRIMVVSAPIIIGDGVSAVGDLGTKTIDKALKLFNVDSKRIGADCLIIGDLK
jgi:diaminohydroxyphosphoribosylaminopyrimidine deaminase / 5-amino-6-(5-phosphoribosylamino)uracil reductase